MVPGSGTAAGYRLDPNASSAECPRSVNAPFTRLSFRSMKTPTWSRRPSRAELTASTQPTCQPRDSSSRRHLGYSGVLFTMQHSVQHIKKLGEKGRERASVRNLIHCAWLVGSMAASYLKEKYVDFIWHSRGTSPNEVWDGEWVRVRMSGYMLQKKAKHLHRMCWETCRHNFCVIGAVVLGKLLQMTRKTKIRKTPCLPRENQGH